MIRQRFEQEAADELTAILDFWLNNAFDTTQGGFIGRLDNSGRTDPGAPKGLVLNARILWTFSAAYRQTGNPDHRIAADWAYAYFTRYFYDREFGGVYWSLTPTGQPLSTRKQIYGLAFAIYGLSEYYRATAEPDALAMCLELYAWIETYSFDSDAGGYFEAFSRDGELLTDLRLSEKDRNDPKTMNTHLHIVEGYANLYRIWPDAGLNQQLRGLLNVFKTHILPPDSAGSTAHHLRLFFTADWQPTANLISYGHDIEASWLLLEAAEVLHDEVLINEFRQIAIDMARATAEALQPDGSLLHELNLDTNHYDTHREWWVSAEAMVGFLNAWQLTGETSFFEQAVGAWEFAKQHLLDPAGGEWRWGVFDDYTPMDDDDKIGFWKCPYHNSRACIEVVNRCRAVGNGPMGI